jgi:hypothetical protein
MQTIHWLARWHVVRVRVRTRPFLWAAARDIMHTV